jgi:heme A synthase
MDRFARFSWFTLAYNVAVILWGAAVRATGSGAGCGSHWPLCNGEVLPRAPQLATLIEYSHRLTSGVALLLVIALVVLAWRHRPKGHAARRAAVLSLVFILTEAAVGAGLVLFELVADNQSIARAMFMSAHLLNTFILLAVLTETARLASGGAPFHLRGQRALAGGLLAGLVGLLLAGMSGAIAALGDTLFPSLSLAQALEADFSPTAHLLIRLRVLHPLLAVAAGLWVGWQGLQLFKQRLSPEVGRYGRWTAALVFVQILAGAVNVLLLAPIWMQIVHLLLADLLWIVYVLLGASALAARQAPVAAAAPAGALASPG